MKVTMSLNPTVYCFVLFVLLDVAVKSHMSSNSNTHSFSQGGNEVRYIVDSIPVSVHKEFSSHNHNIRIQNGDDAVDRNSTSNLKFEPPLLDFEERQLGVPHHEKVHIINKNVNKTVHMSSISGNTVHFHSSFFDNKVIPPLGNTSFNVVFLGRDVGEVESNLFIHTSEGSFKYQVRGTSVRSPYRLRPLSGVRLPLNASFSPIIHMHNPNPTPLQLVEVYSSGGEFHLELPSGELEGPKHLWEIPAFLTKPIIRIRFYAEAQKNHTAYIRLKVNNSEEVLVVPLEVEVGPSCGLYTAADIIDFGIGGSNDPPTSVDLWLHNSWKKPIKIQNVINTPVSKALKIAFQPVKIPPESNEAVKVAQLTFDWAVALETGHTSGKIVVKSKQSTQKLVIPYTATVLAGGLSYDGEVTRFRSDSPHNPPRSFQLTNNFKLPIAITNVSLPKDAQPYFNISKFEPVILQPAQTAPLFFITPSPTSLPHLTMDSTIVITTNVSTLSVPLLCYNGKLRTLLSERNETELELGTIGSETEKQILFALVNENPVSVTILSWETSLPFTSVTLAAVQDTYVPWQTINNNTTKERSVRPGQYAVVRVSVCAGSQLGESHGHISLRTQYETIQIATHMRVELGSLQVQPDPVIFNNCFPGKVCSEVLRVQSLFSIAMAVTGVSGVPGDPRLIFSPVAPPLIPPAASTALGTLSFNTRLLPAEDNYLAATHNVTGGTRWHDTLELPAHCTEYDHSLLRARYNHFSNLSSRLLNITLHLDTTEVREHMFRAQVRLTWPQLATDVSFPLTQVGNTSERSLTIHNPGTQLSVMVQLVRSSTYPGASPPRSEPLRGEAAPGVPGGFVVDASYSQYRVTAGDIHRDTWAFLLPPLANTSVTVRFTPKDAQAFSTLMLLRNNLTVLETIQLTGTGAYAQFTFGNRLPGSETPLAFDLAEKHLKNCEKEKQRKFPAPNLTVKRSFTARNTGALPISVHGFDISGQLCEGYGFRVLNCEPFSLPPNITRKVDIAFTPDFTLARVERKLNVWTSSHAAVNYTLVATLPPFLLGSCSSVLARPSWEPLLYYCAVTFMTFLLVCVLAAAFLESNRALKCALLAMSRDTIPTQSVLDLKSIGTGVGLMSNSVPVSSDLPANKVPPKQTTTPGPTSTSTTISPQEPEVVKEKRVKAEVESTSEVFSSPPPKCIKKKEKTVSKRFTDITNNSCPERRRSWTNDFSKMVTSLPKPQLPTPVTPESTKLPLQGTKRKVSKKHHTLVSSLGHCVREEAPLPITSPVSSVGEDTETSSTTTDSSHDDGDKEVEITMALREIASPKSPRTRVPRAKVNHERNAGSASSHEWEDEEPAEKEPLVKKTHNNSRNRKSSSKMNKMSESGSAGQNGSRSKNSSGNKQGNLRIKEKQVLTHKKSSEKLLPAMPKPVTMYEPPPPPLSLWDESRASFSDVVARSDTTTKQTLTQATPTTSALLGPIGSKKTYPTSMWDHHWSDGGELSSTSTPAPSYYRDPPRPAPPPTVVQSAARDGGWADQQNLMLKLMVQAEEQRRLEMEQQQQQQQQHTVYHDTWSPWAPTTPSTTLWGSDVWAPPPPPNTWAPPGFAPRPASRRDPDIDAGLDYDPFRSMSDIWAPPLPSNNFWKPPTKKNNE